MPDSHDIGVLVLAGGEATRLPGKLYLDAGSEPMLVRVFNNVRAERTTFISSKGMLPPDIDAAIDAPMIVDRWSRRGPLAGLLSTMSAMPNRWVFAVAGDAPFVTSAFIDRLAEQIIAGDEAIVPRHRDGAREQLEPLAALYDRLAFLREGMPLLLSGTGALRAVIDRLQTHIVDVDDAQVFTNVNTPSDYDAVRGAFA